VVQQGQERKKEEDMKKPVSSLLKRLSGLAVLVIAILLIGASCPTENQLPVIFSLTTNQDRLDPLASCQIECIASDPDGDELSYSWSAAGGLIWYEGPTAIWMAPEALGNYTITVVVSDGRNGEATEQIAIQVLAPNQPPFINSLTTDCPRVKPGHTATITCVASDPDGDELSYSWSAEAGNISGEGDTVTWVAPNDYGTYTIIVTVADGRGSQVIQSLDIIVCGCGSAC
jgi:hypothetical protein